MNPEHQSWRMRVVTPRGDLEFVWGPLTGFGVCDYNIDSGNSWAPFDFAFEPLQAAETYLIEYVNQAV